MIQPLPDEETFANAQIWKNQLRGTYTVPLWQGERDGHHVAVWSNAIAAILLPAQQSSSVATAEHHEHSAAIGADTIDRPSFQP